MSAYLNNGLMSVKKELTSGVMYTAIAKYSGMAIQLVITAILARILAPEDYGIIAIAYVFINFFNILSDIGIGPAIIQNKTLNDNDLKNIFSFTVYMGLILSCVFFFCSWPITHYYNKDILLPVCQSLCILILSNCILIVPLNLLYKEKQFKLISFTTLLIQTTTGIISIIAAYNGLGIYSLVLSYLLSSILLAIFYLYKKRMTFKLIPGIESLKKIFSFSSYQFLFNIINYFGRNVDKMLIGRMAGLQALGYYEKSYRLMLLPLQNITFVITPVMLPVFSSLQDSIKEMTDKYMKVLKLMSYIGFPLSIILFFCGRELILLFFGDQWEEAVDPFQILSLTVGMQILTSSTGSIFQATNNTKKMFMAGCCGTFFMITSFVTTLSLWGTITAVATGYLMAQIANTVQCFYLILRSLDYSIRAYVRSLLKPLLVTCVVGLGLAITTYFLQTDYLLVSLIVKGGIGVIIALVMTQLTGDYDIISIAKSEVLKR